MSFRFYTVDLGTENQSNDDPKGKSIGIPAMKYMTEWSENNIDMVTAPIYGWERRQFKGQ